MDIMNSRGDSASPWKMSLWIFVSAMLLPPAVSSTLQVFMVCSMKFMTSCHILYILRRCNIQLIIIIIIYSLRVFHLSFSWWSFTKVWVTASFLMSQGLFSVFWPISIMLSFGWSPLVLLFPIPPVPLIILRWLYQEQQLQMSHSCSTIFSIPSKADVLIFLFTFFQFYSVVSCNSKIHNFASSLFLLLIIIRSGRLAEIMWSIYMFKSLRSLCVPFSRTDTGLCLYHLFVWPNFNFSHNSQRITLPTQSCLVLYFFCVNLLQSLIMSIIIQIISFSLSNKDKRHSCFNVAPKFQNIFFNVYVCAFLFESHSINPGACLIWIYLSILTIVRLM